MSPHAALDAGTSAQWIEAARAAHDAGGRLVALWATDDRDRDGTFAVLAAFATREALNVVKLGLHPDEAYPDLSGLFVSARRMQRAVRDLLGIEAAEARDTRPWLRH